MHSAGSGHVHGGRDGRMSFEHDDAALREQLAAMEEEELLPPSPLAHPDPRLDAEARDYFRKKLDRL